MALILVLDDEAPLRSAVRRILERAGHEVLEASDGRQGLALANERYPDLVITDILMPGVDGIELILELREHRPDTLIIAISGGGDLVPSERLLSDAHALGAITALPKPFEVPEVLSAVGSALARSGGDWARGDAPPDPRQAAEDA